LSFNTSICNFTCSANDGTCNICFIWKFLFLNSVKTLSIAGRLREQRGVGDKSGREEQRWMMQNTAVVSLRFIATMLRTHTLTKRFIGQANPSNSELCFHAMVWTAFLDLERAYSCLGNKEVGYIFLCGVGHRWAPLSQYSEPRHKFSELVQIRHSP
jgi:hypothetical protein